MVVERETIQAHRRKRETESIDTESFGQGIRIKGAAMVRDASEEIGSFLLAG